MQNPVGIFFMDDSVGTNNEECSLVAIVSFDSNGHFQILAYGFMSRVTTEQFSVFLADLKSNLIKQPKAFLVDRNVAQKVAIESIFPETPIFYCLLHLASNIKSLFKDGKLINIFWMSVHDFSNEEKLINTLTKIANST
jgi:hypothetical protein